VSDLLLRDSVHDQNGHHDLVHVRKRNQLVNGSILSVDHRSQSESTRRKRRSDRPKDGHDQDRVPSVALTNIPEDNKTAQPYFLIQPQSVVVLPNETGRSARQCDAAVRFSMHSV
jgi:hypothetical protein